MRIVEQIKLLEPATILAFLNFGNKRSLIKAHLSLPMIFRKSRGSAALAAGQGTFPLLFAEHAAWPLLCEELVAPVSRPLCASWSFWDWFIGGTQLNFANWLKPLFTAWHSPGEDQDCLRGGGLAARGSTSKPGSCDR